MKKSPNSLQQLFSSKQEEHHLDGRLIPTTAGGSHAYLNNRHLGQRTYSVLKRRKALPERR